LQHPTKSIEDGYYVTLLQFELNLSIKLQQFTCTNRMILITDSKPDP